MQQRATSTCDVLETFAARALGHDQHARPGDSATCRKFAASVRTGMVAGIAPRRSTATKTICHSTQFGKAMSATIAGADTGARQCGGSLSAAARSWRWVNCARGCQRQPEHPDVAG